MNRFNTLLGLLLVVISSCLNNTPKLQNATPLTTDTANSKNNIVSSKEDCLFDMDGFGISMKNLETDTFFLTYKWDNANHKGYGQMKNGYFMSCVLEVCDTWGFDAEFYKYNPNYTEKVSTALIKELFQKLPTTPNKKKYIDIIDANANQMAFEGNSKEKRVNLSIADENEFFIDLSHKNDTTYVSILMNSYY